MTETRHPDGSDLDNRHRFGARARHAGDSPTAVCTGDIKALARSLRSKLQARVYQAWIFYRKASAKGSSEIAARSPGMVVVGAVVAPTRARAFPVIYPATQIGNGSCLPIASGPWARSGRRSSTLLRRSLAPPKARNGATRAPANYVIARHRRHLGQRPRRLNPFAPRNICPLLQQPENVREDPI